MFTHTSRTEFSLYRPPLACLPALIRKSLLAGLLLMPALSLGQTFVQENNNTVPDILASVSVTYGATETAGNLNVVVVGWSDTSSSVTSVVDDNTNTYVLAGTTSGNGITQAIYYARSIVLPNNNTPTITVAFNQPASFPDVRILEYSGFSATAPLDNWTGLGCFRLGGQWRNRHQHQQPDPGRGHDRGALHRGWKWFYPAIDHRPVR